MALKPDAYYGDVARNYDASRSHKAKWKNEIATVERFVQRGPVLDMPLGTGRFIPCYRAKGMEFVGADISGDMLAIAKEKFGDIKITQAAADDLPFADGSFATAVCIRFLEWLPLFKASLLIRDLHRIAKTVIVSINHGVEGRPDAYTYDLNKFLLALDGLFIERREVTAEIPGITSEIFKLRAANFSDVLEQFMEPRGARDNLQRVADKHAAFLAMQPIPIYRDTVSVRAEYRDAEDIRTILRSMDDFGFVTSEPPRRMGGPLTILERDGHTFVLDGRRRANIATGVLPVLVVRPD